MAEATPSEICDDLVARLRTSLGADAVTYGPPEAAPNALHYWVRYGPIVYEWGTFTVPHPTITITVAVPRNSNYPSEYRFVTDKTAEAVAALYGPIMLAGQAPITGVSAGEATGTNYAGVADALMAAVITIDIENKEVNTL